MRDDARARVHVRRDRGEDGLAWGGGEGEGEGEGSIAARRALKLWSSVAQPGTSESHTTWLGLGLGFRLRIRLRVRVRVGVS